MGSFLSVVSQLGWIISWIRVTGRQLLARLHMLGVVGEFFPPAFQGVGVVGWWGGVRGCAFGGDAVSGGRHPIAPTLYPVAVGGSRTVSCCGRRGGWCVVAATVPRVLVGGPIRVRVGSGSRVIEGVGGFGEKPRGSTFPSSTTTVGGCVCRCSTTRGTTSRWDSSPRWGSVAGHVLLGIIVAETPVRGVWGKVAVGLWPPPWDDSAPTHLATGGCRILFLACSVLLGFHPRPQEYRHLLPEHHTIPLHTHGA